MPYNASAQQRFDGKTWTQPNYQELQNWYMSLPGAGVESYSYRPDGSGICLRDDVNGVVTGFGINCADAFPGYKFLEYGSTTTISPDILKNDQWTGNYVPCSGTSCWGGYSGGQTPNYNGYTFRWGYGGGVVEQSIALEAALKASGLVVDGYTYLWRIKNADANYNQSGADDPMYVTVDIYDANGNLQETFAYDYTGHYDWRNFEGFEVFNRAYNASSINIRLEGDDIGYWAGYYGPEFDVNTSYINMIYRSDPCFTNPLFSPECSGYAEAWAQQEYDNQCKANPLYDIGCPGYDQAYLTQQCSADPLYDQSCSGYAEAYYEQQCTINPLYDQGCANYATAYYDQQCSINPFYDIGCSGYAAAYLAQQCEINQLYDISCPSYAEAYYDQQCSLDALYDLGCDGYAEAVVAEYVDKAPTPTASIPEIPTATSVPSVTGDPTIDSVLGGNNNVTTTNLVPGLSPVDVTGTQTQEVAQATQEKVDDSREAESRSDVEEQVGSEGNDQESGSGQENTDSPSNGSGGRDKPSEQDRANSRRERVKEIMTEKAKELANSIASATSMEQQRAIQAQMLAAIGFNPDFTAYKTELADTPLYEDPGMTDSRLPPQERGLRNGLANQILHNKMVDMQYE